MENCSSRKRKKQGWGKLVNCKCLPIRLMFNKIKFKFRNLNFISNFTNCGTINIINQRMTTINKQTLPIASKDFQIASDLGFPELQ